jgi:CHRD domain-containing protein
MALKSRRLFAVAVLAVLAALSLALPASAVTPAAGTEDETPLATLQTRLTGAKEVPGPGDPNGRGRATVEVFSGKVCFTLKVKRIQLVDLAAHIHQGSRREAGPVVVTLEPLTGAFSEGCVPVSDPALITALSENPEGYYVNVHNAKYPDGAIRGQLHKL